MQRANNSVKTLETWRLLPKEVQTLIVASFFVAVGFGVIVPAIPIYSRSFGVSAAAVGFVVSTFAIMRFISGLFSGKLVNRFGERHVFSVGVLMVAISAFLSGIAENYWQLLTFRTAGGLGSSMFSVAASSVIFKSISPELRGRAQSIYNGTFLIGAVAGPAIGGTLMSISLRAPFFGYSIMLLISGSIAYRYLKASHLQPENNKADEMSIKDALKLPAFRIAFVTSFMFGLAILGPRLSIIPLFVVEELKGSNTLVGFVYTLAALIQGTFLMRAGRLSDHRGRRFVLKMGSSITWLGLAMFLFAGHKSVFIIAMMVIGFGTAFLSTTPSAIVADVITGKSGKVIGFFQMAGDAGMIVGPILSGFLADAYSFEAAFAATLAIYSITVLLAWRLPETLVATED
ncbi:MAG: MFS transporter [Candidatus Nanopelagicaceae bacterium]